LLRINENEHGQRSGKFAPLLKPRPAYGRAALACGLVRFALTSARQGYWDFLGNAVQSLGELALLTGADAVRHDGFVTCNLCGWSGRRFYPNTGAGYHEHDSICPGCMASDRYRSLYEIMRRCTSVFTPGNRIVEVAPLRSLETIFRKYPGLDYVSFDIELHAMERGDITNMRYRDDSVDWFICFHVLEHIPDEPAALREMHRILRPGGAALLQVPVDWAASATREYGAPDPRDVDHVRRHGRDFAERIAAAGFDVEKIDPVGRLDMALISREGLSPEPIFMARAVK
jgi:SAM-dependent methyltransferase